MKEIAIPFANCRPTFIFEGLPDKDREVSSVARKEIIGGHNRRDLHSCYNLSMSHLTNLDESESYTSAYSDKLYIRITKEGSILMCLINQRGVPDPEGDTTESLFSFYKCDMFEAFGRVVEDVRGDDNYTARFSYINNDGSSIYFNGSGAPKYCPPKKPFDKTLEFKTQINSADCPGTLCREYFTRKIYGAFGYEVPTDEG